MNASHVFRAFAVLALCGISAGVAAQQIRPELRPTSLVIPQGPMPPAAQEAPATTPPAPAEGPAPTPQQALTPAGANGPVLGPETNLPLPRYVSLKTDEGNVRRGPSLSHRIDWVFLRRDMPLRVVAEYGHWRRVVDREGVGGWVHYALISGTRTVIVDEDMLTIRGRPTQTAPANAALEAGVVARLGDCTPDWCRISAGGYRGWAPKSALWGVEADEIRD